MHNPIIELWIYGLGVFPAMGLSDKEMGADAQPVKTRYQLLNSLLWPLRLVCIPVAVVIVTVRRLVRDMDNSSIAEDQENARDSAIPTDE